MLSMQDVIDYCDLECGEIEAIAEHEHVPLPVAVVMGELLLSSPQGVCELHRIVAEDIQHAVDQGDLQSALKFAETYQFVAQKHPLPH